MRCKNSSSQGGIDKGITKTGWTLLLGVSLVVRLLLNNLYIKKDNVSGLRT